MDAGSYAASAASLGLIRRAFQGGRGAARRSLLAEIGESARWLWWQPLIRYPAFLTGSLNFASGMQLIVIVLAQRRGIPSAAIGGIFALAGLGGLVGALLAPRVQRRLTFGQAVIGVCWAWVAFYALLASVSHLAAVAALLAVFFVIAPTDETVQLSYRLALIPDTLQGRVNSAFRLVAFGMQPLGLALTGGLLQEVGVPRTALTLAGWVAATALLTTATRHVRHAPALAGPAAA